MNPGWRIWTMGPSLIILQILWFPTKIDGFSNGYATIPIYYFVGSILTYKICSNLSTNILPQNIPTNRKKIPTKETQLSCSIQPMLFTTK
jgi:hypothetical protein